MENIGRIVWLLPPFGQMGLYREGARRYIRTNSVLDQCTVHEAHGVLGLAINRELRVEVWGIIAPDAQDTAAFGLPGCGTPALRGARERPGRQRDAGCQAGLQEMTTAQTFGGCVHTVPSLLKAIAHPES